MAGDILSDALKNEKRGESTRIGEEYMENRKKRLDEKKNSGGMFDFLYKKRRESEDQLNKVMEE